MVEVGSFHPYPETMLCSQTHSQACECNPRWLFCTTTNLLHQHEELETKAGNLVTSIS